MCFFIVGYVRKRNCLSSALEFKTSSPKGAVDLAAELCSDFWHRWKRSSFRVCAKAYLVAMVEEIDANGVTKCLMEVEVGGRS